MKYLLLGLLFTGCEVAVYLTEDRPFVVIGVEQYAGGCKYGSKNHSTDIFCPCIYNIGDTIKLQ
jgi:hypothetical protein